MMSSVTNVFPLWVDNLATIWRILVLEHLTIFGFSHKMFLMLQIKLGTMDQSEAQIEWVIRPYMNTTKKRKFLGD